MKRFVILSLFLLSIVAVAHDLPFRRLSIKNPRVINAIQMGHQTHNMRSFRAMADAEMGAKQGFKQPKPVNVLCMMPLTAKLCRPW